MRQFQLLILMCSAISIASAQTTDSLKSPVRTLTSQEYNALVKGEDLSHMDLVTDINGFPSAEKALKYKKEIALNTAQVAALNQVNDGLVFKKKEMGQFIIRNEKALDSLFRTNKVNEGVIIYYANRFGLYQGELRNAILQAAYKTRRLLTAPQLNKLQGLKK